MHDLLRCRPNILLAFLFISSLSSFIFTLTTQLIVKVSFHFSQNYNRSKTSYGQIYVLQINVCMYIVYMEDIPIEILMDNGSANNPVSAVLPR